ncbi:hypothetical protein [Agrobacterium vitis]|uniref:hypothetical protein n=1 Tax=Agrobacterium vitis TaxID=373 RepID=UPI0012E98A11|nr:hypothetical protein [Agrobacterium vitis]MUZ65313.1 hypothetical protein [Agrobacterium vitis]
MRPKIEIVRPTTEERRKDIKTVCARAIRQVGAANFEHDTRVGTAQLSKYGAPVDVNYMPVDIVADLEAVIGYPLISEFLAGLAGYVLVPTDASADAPDLSDIGLLQETKGKLIALMIKSLLDGHWDRHERREILPVLDAAIAQLQGIRRGIAGGAE